MLPFHLFNLKKNFMPSLLCLLFRLLEKGKEHVRYAGYTHHMVGCHLLFITKRYTKKRVMIYHFLAIQSFSFKYHVEWEPVSSNPLRPYVRRFYATLPCLMRGITDSNRSLEKHNGPFISTRTQLSTYYRWWCNFVAKNKEGKCSKISSSWQLVSSKVRLLYKSPNSKDNVTNTLVQSLESLLCYVPVNQILCWGGRMYTYILRNL